MRRPLGLDSFASESVSSSVSEFSARTPPTQATPSPEPLQQIGHTFRLAQEVNLVPPCQSKQITKASYIHTCISASAETFASVTPKEFFVYTFSSIQSSHKPSCVGKLESDGTVQVGVDNFQLEESWCIGYDKNGWSFGCAAISDSIIAIALSAKGCVLLLPLKAGKHSHGTHISKIMQPDGVVQKVMFSTEGQELAVLSSFSATNKETWHFYSVERLATGFARRHRATDMRMSERSMTDGEVSLNMIYPVETNVGSNGYLYHTRDAKFSADGTKLVTCTGQVYGSELVSLLGKDAQGKWTLLGRCQFLAQKLHPYDLGCLGFTGVSL